MMMALDDGADGSYGQELATAWLSVAENGLQWMPEIACHRLPG
ncbi:hypothetical protein [Billgrantia endophytica]|nr:hypothetical protein [Halomonas endophytica]